MSARARTPDVDPRRLVFVGGLHRSGTTALGRILSDHPEVSGFSQTPAEEDEGQHLQQVYAPAHAHGGPGRFAFAHQAHLIEVESQVAPTDARRLLAGWTPHWDLERPVLVEKSPPNLLMGRYLQSVFPGSALVVILRHPVVVALSTKKWAPRVSLSTLVRHWFVAHDTLSGDASQLDRLLVLRYEDLMEDPERELSRVADFVELEGPLDPQRLDARRSSGYIQTWQDMASGSLLQRRRRRRIIERFGTEIRGWGYDPEDLTATHPWTFQGRP